MGARWSYGWRAFRTYVRHVLAPTLRRGDVVVLDNLPAHKIAGIREAIAARRARIFYLPPYSPDMNPIEMAFSKLKSLLRQEPARTIDGLVERTGHLLDRFLPSECANFFHAADYQTSETGSSWLISCMHTPRFSGRP